MNTINALSEDDFYDAKQIKNVAIATKVFNKFYPEFIVSEKDPFLTATVNLFPAFVEEISKEWGIDECNIRPASDREFIFEISRDWPNVYLIDKNGFVYTAVAKQNLTGNQTWNGDDYYFDEIETKYSDLEKIEQLDRFRKLIFKKSNCQDYEDAAAQLIAILYQ